LAEILFTKTNKKGQVGEASNENTTRKAKGVGGEGKSSTSVLIKKKNKRKEEKI